jgi:hypothetical protein
MEVKNDSGDIRDIVYMPKGIFNDRFLIEN